MKVLFESTICETDMVDFYWKECKVSIFINDGSTIEIKTYPGDLDRIYDCFASSSKIDLRSYNYEVIGRTYNSLLTEIDNLM